MSVRVQIVDDEKNIVEALRYNLAREGFEVLVAFDGVTGLQQARDQLPDLILLDWMLPGLDGLSICRLLCAEEATRHIPIILMTVRSAEADVVAGLEVGADDYVTKPFGTREVIARVKTALRRRATLQPAAEEVWSVDTLRAEWTRHRVTLDNEPLELTSKEFGLLKALADARGRVLGREKLLETVWGYEHSMAIGTRTVDLHISQLRRKLGPVSTRLVTVKNAGYRFDIDPT